MSQGYFLRATRAVLAAGAIGLASIVGAGAAQAATINPVHAIDGSVTGSNWNPKFTQLDIHHTLALANECSIDYTVVRADGVTESAANQALGDGAIGGTYSIRATDGSAIHSVTYKVTCIDFEQGDPTTGTEVTVAGPTVVNGAALSTTNNATAVNPTVNDGTCNTTTGVAGSITVPATAGVVYLLDGRAVAAGTVPVTGGVHVVTAQAATGYTLTNPGFRFSYDFGPCTVTPGATRVTATAPRYVERCTATSIGEIYIPAIKGVNYLIKGKVVTGTIPVVGAGEIIVTAAAQPGYALTNTTATWSHVFPACSAGTATPTPTTGTATTTATTTATPTVTPTGTNSDTPTVIETDVPAAPADHSGLLAGAFAGLTGVAGAAFFLARRRDED